MKHFLLVITLLFTLNSQAQTLETDRLALIDLYNNTTGSNWTNKTGWTVPGTNGDNPCGWFGVTCSGGRVSEISLYNNNLTGTIPTSIGTISALKLLSLGSNHLSGIIPVQISNLTNLTGLYLYLNQLSGAIPIEIGNLSQLRRLSLYNNQLTGTIPVELSNLTLLEELGLNNNQLGGSIPLEIGNMIQLKWIYLYNNLLTGSIPASFGNLVNVTSLFLSNNQLTGSIPATLGNMSSLYSIVISYNNLSGSLPVELCTLPLLRQLILSSNKITGPIPAQIGNLPVLENLYLDNNLLTGTIPPSIGNLSLLQSINLGSNQLTGVIPAELGNITSLRQAYLYYNQLTGAIPQQLGNLSNLFILWLHGNQISGNIPAQLGNLINLTSLNLSNNQLTGSIPAALGAISGFALFAMSYNQLSGTVPDLSAIPVTSNVLLNNNKFNFSGIETNVNKLDTYSPQAKIAITNVSNTLSTDAGGTLANNTYKWFKDGALVQTNTGNNNFNMTSTGAYRVEITNSIAAQLTLVSDNYIQSGPLPVTLLNFNGTRSDLHNLLKWSTIAETNNAGFEIERSSDARHFEKVGAVDGKGESTTVQSYQFTDKSPFSLSYYRLKQLDYNGTTSYSRIIQISTEEVSLKIYPNPVREILTVENSTEGKSIKIYDLAGRLIYTKPATRKQMIVTSDFLPGAYLLSVGNKTAKFVVEN
jgi:Leucine-rich repeat (LRR) protein